MNISKKVLLSFGISIFILCSLVGLAIHFLVLNSYKELGVQNHQKSHQQSLMIFENKIKEMDEGMLDWTVWDDLYYFVSIPSSRKTFIDSNLSNKATQSLGLDLVSIWDSQKNLILLRYDPNKKGDYTQYPNNTFKDSIKNYLPNLFPKDPSKTSVGLVKVEKGTLLVISQPIYKTDHLSKPNGRFIYGRFLNSEFENEFQSISAEKIHFKELTHSEVEAYREVSSEDPTNLHLEVKNCIKNGLSHYHLATTGKEKQITAGLTLFETTDSRLISKTVLLDLNLKPLVYIESSEPRTLFYVTLNKMLLFYFVFLVAAALATAFNLTMIHKWVVERLKNLDRSIQDIREEKCRELVYEAPEKKDELDNLALNLKQTIKELIEQENALIESKLEAEKANLSKTHFLANMSHEIRTPLHSLLGGLDLIQETNLSKEQERYLEISKISGKTLLEILGDILDFSKIEAGDVELNTTNFNLDTLVQEIDVLKRHQSEEKGLKFIIEKEIDFDCELEGDHIRLKQVIVNLIANARKYTQSGEIITKIKATKLNNDEAHIFVSVTDTGIGIPKEKLGKVFDRFYQVDESSKKRTYGGVGLGLSISQAIIERLGGEIQVDSRLNHGSTFWFSIKLPLAQPNFCKLDYTTIQEKAFRGGISLNSKNIDPSKILIVDDQPLNRTIMEKFFSRLSLKCDMASDGKVAVEMCSSKNYDLILMDIQMPEMDGIEANRLIKWQTKGVKPFIVALTANTSEADIKYYLNCGFDDFLGKPVSLNTLKEYLLKWQSNYGLYFPFESTKEEQQI